MSIIFTSVNHDPIAIKLIRHGQPTLYGDNKYTTDTIVEQQNYTIGEWITTSGFINFDLRDVSKSNADYCQFVTSGGDIAISGVIGQSGKYRNYNLFKGCKNIVDASQIQINGIGSDHCCENMFADCTKLRSGPYLFHEWAQRWAYAGMFYNCQSLTGTALPKGSILHEGCYSWMFYNCKNLSTAPVLSSAGTSPYCYNSMFQGCSNLTATPVLSATNLKEGCYKNMFIDCKNLRQINIKFKNWDEAATENWVKYLPPTGIFYKPEQLNTTYGKDYIPKGWSTVGKKTPFTFRVTNDQDAYVKLISYNAVAVNTIYYTKDGKNWNSFSTDTYVRIRPNEYLAVSGSNPGFSTGPYTYFSFATSGAGLLKVYGNIMTLADWHTYITYGYQFTNIFRGCDNIVDAGELILPNNTSQGCYFRMFHNCTNLTAAPYLPATILSERCYAQMFRNCSSLSSINVNFTTWGDAYTASWVQDVASGGTFYKPSALDTSYSVSRIPSGWTVVNK